MGIMFKPELLKKILAGEKTMTRREIRGLNTEWKFDYIIGRFDEFLLGDKGDIRRTVTKRSRYSTGSCVYIKEKHFVFRGEVYYEDTEKNSPATPVWKNKMFMAAKNARHHIKILKVHIERLTDISEEDAKAEGVEPGRLLGYGSIGCETYKEGFLLKWIEINGSVDLKKKIVFAYKFEKV